MFSSANISPMRFICILFTLHTLINSILLSSTNNLRCIFWERLFLTRDEKWIANWYAFSHFHVGILLAALSFGSPGAKNYDTTICYIILAIITTYLVEGIFCIETLDRRLVNLQVAVFSGLVGAIFYFTLEHEQNQPRIIVLPRKLTSSSFDRRKKMPIATLALAAQFVGSVFRLADMVLGEGKDGYTGNMSSPVYQIISKMALCDMLLVSALLGATLRFFEVEQQKNVLWGHVAGLMVSLAMLASDQGKMMDEDQRKGGAIGTFVSILTAVVGAL